MKCPKCGAEVGNTKFCEYCGSQLTAEMQKEQERLNKEGCPKCGSSNITFKRENQGEVKGKHSKQVLHRTVGVCKDCGYTWYSDNEVKKKKTWLWVLGWIFIFPVPLTIILLRKKDMNNILKYSIIAVAWIVYIAIAFSGGGSSDTTTTSNDNTTTISAVEQVTEAVTEETTTELATTTTATTTATTTTKPSATLGELNALAKALQYLDYSGFSKKSLKDQLKYEGYSSDEIDYAIKNCDADWKEECAEKAQQYLDYGSFSKSGLRDQLEYEGFTSEQIDYALKAVGY